MLDGHQNVIYFFFLGGRSDVYFYGRKSVDLKYMVEIYGNLIFFMVVKRFKLKVSF